MPDDARVGEGSATAQLDIPMSDSVLYSVTQLFACNQACVT